jgi:hypothetical protein
MFTGEKFVTSRRFLLPEPELPIRAEKEKNII